MCDVKFGRVGRDVQRIRDLAVPEAKGHLREDLRLARGQRLELRSTVAVTQASEAQCVGLPLAGGSNQPRRGGVRRACNHLERRIGRKDSETFLQPGMDVIAVVISEQDQGWSTVQGKSVDLRDGISSDIENRHIRPGESRVLPIGQGLSDPDHIETFMFAESGTQPRQDQRRR